MYMYAQIHAYVSTDTHTHTNILMYFEILAFLKVKTDIKRSRAMVAHAFSPRTQEAETGESL